MPGSENSRNETASPVFVDANVLVALFNASDSLHARAVALWQLLREQGSPLVTSDFVVAEALTVLRLRAGIPVALEFGAELLYKTKALEIISVDRPLLYRAFEVFSRIPARDMSFTDATIIALSQERGFIVVTFDATLRKFLGEQR